MKLQPAAGPALVQLALPAALALLAGWLAFGFGIRLGGAGMAWLAAINAALFTWLMAGGALDALQRRRGP